MALSKRAKCLKNLWWRSAGCSRVIPRRSDFQRSPPAETSSWLVSGFAKVDQSQPDCRARGFRAKAPLKARKEKEGKIMLARLYRILLIEDDPSLAQSIWCMVQGGQDLVFQVVSAESLRAASSKLASEKFDAVLLDANVREFKRLASITEICSHGGPLPIVVLVSQKEEELGKQSLTEGAAEYLLKESLNQELLRKTLRYAIEFERVENAAWKCEQRFHDLFENTKDILFTLDLVGNITSLNKSGEEVMGLSRSEALRNNIKNLVAPEHHGICREMMQRVLNEEPLQF